MSQNLYKTIGTSGSVASFLMTTPDPDGDQHKSGGIVNYLHTDASSPLGYIQEKHQKASLEIVSPKGTMSNQGSQYRP